MVQAALEGVELALSEPGLVGGLSAAPQAWVLALATLLRFPTDDASVDDSSLLADALRWGALGCTMPLLGPVTWSCALRRTMEAAWL